MQRLSDLSLFYICEFGMFRFCRVFCCKIEQKYGIKTTLDHRGRKAGRIGPQEFSTGWTIVSD